MSLKRFEGDRWPSLERRRERERQQLLGFPPNPGSSSLSDPPRGWSFSPTMSRCIVKRAPEAAAFYFLGVRAPSVQRLKHCCLVKINELEVESALREATEKQNRRRHTRNSFRATPPFAYLPQTDRKQKRFNNNLISDIIRDNRLLLLFAYRTSILFIPFIYLFCLSHLRLTQSN